MDSRYPENAVSDRVSRPSLLRIAALTVALTAAAVAVDAAAGVWPPWAEEEVREPTYPAVSATVDELASNLGAPDLIVVDARSADAYLAGHVPTAVSIPAFEVPNPPKSAAAFSERGLTGRERIVCYGQGSCSADAARLFWLLEVHGAGRVSILMAASPRGTRPAARSTVKRASSPRPPGRRSRGRTGSRRPHTWPSSSVRRASRSSTRGAGMRGRALPGLRGADTSPTPFRSTSASSSRPTGG